MISLNPTSSTETVSQQGPVTARAVTDSAEDVSPNPLSADAERSAERDGAAPKTPEPGPESQSCTHCNLPVPKGLIQPGAAEQFCCNGCRTAFEIIHSCDLTEFYRFAENQQSLENTPKESFEQFDSEHFREEHTQAFGDENADLPLRQVQFMLEGLHCNACIWLIEKLPRICPAVASARVNWSTQVVTVVYDSDAKLSRIADTLARLGYLPSPYQPDQTAELSKKENRRTLFDLGFAGAAAGNNMLVALALYLGQYYGMSPAIERLLVFYSGIISLFSILGPGRQILKRAVWAIRTRTPHMDLPVAIGISVGVVSGWINLMMDSAVVYFDSISILIFVLLLGRYFQQLQQRKAITQISLVKQIIPQFCTRVDGSRSEKVSVDQVAAGDLIQIDRNETIPVDGEIEEGQSTIDFAVMTGESIPRKACAGDLVYAGATNMAHTIIVKASAAAAQSRIATIFAEVEQSIRTKSKIVQFADRVGAKFVLAILLLALTAFLIWLPNYAFALNAAVAVLIVACPCALALATPLAISVALHAALRRQILIKDGDSFELLAKCKTIWFDKTGTLTHGNLCVTSWYGDDQVRSLVYQVESHCHHPTATAILRSFDSTPETCPAAERSISPEKVQQFSDGVQADLEEGSLRIGTKSFLQQFGIELADDQIEKEQQYLDQGWSPVFISIDSDCVAMLAIGDQINTDSIEVIKELQQRYPVGILSGDRKEIVQRVAGQLGIDAARCFGELSPSMKKELVESNGPSLMIGDGVNDCSALAAASVGIAFNENVDVNARLASIVIKPEQLHQIPRLLAASRRVMNLIFRNITISILYNGLSVTLAMMGYIHPVIAAIIMPVSSISILMISLASDPFSRKENP